MRAVAFCARDVSLGNHTPEHRVVRLEAREVANDTHERVLEAGPFI